jgi:hypothetical protein
MNTIQVTTIDGAVNYTESEVVRYIEKAGQVDKHYEDIRKIRHAVRDFFSEGQWDDGEFSASKQDINELLESIGANKLTTKYRATYTITGSFNVEVEDEDDVESIFTDNVTVDFYDGDIDVDQIEVLDIEEDE